MTNWIVQTLAASTLLMLAVIAFRSLLGKRVHPRLIYMLWALPALRIAVPPLPLLEAASPSIIAMPGSGEDAMGAAAPDAAAIVLTLWLAGALLWFGWQLARYRQFLNVARADRVGSPAWVADIPVHRSGGVDGPVATGILRCEIFVPLDFDTCFDPREARLALAHEAMHHRRRDLLANLVAMIVLALHWFNPLAHWAHRRFRADQELACDADVIRLLGDDHAATYARTLLKATARVPVTLSGLSDASLLKQRLGSLAAVPSRRRQGHLAFLALGLGGSAMLLTAATPARAPAEIRVPALPAIEATASAGSQVAALRNARPEHAGVTTKTKDIDIAAGQPPAASVAPTDAAAEPDAISAGRAAARRHPVDDPAYLARRAAAGLVRAQERYLSPEAAAAARGRPIPAPPNG